MTPREVWLRERWSANQRKRRDTSRSFPSDGVRLPWFRAQLSQSPYLRLSAIKEATQQDTADTKDSNQDRQPTAANSSFRHQRA